MKVELMGSIENAEEIIAAATKGTRDKRPAYEIIDETDLSESKKIIRDRIKESHMSVTEFAFFVFSVSGVSRVLTHQLVRHRLASYLQMSSRHTDLTEMDVVTPPTIEKDEDKKEIYDDINNDIIKAYESLEDMDVEYEDARYISPSGSKTNIVIGMNARELRHFFKLRLCLSAQWEIRILARKMLEIVKKETPSLFIDIEIPCITDEECPHGKKPKACFDKYSLESENYDELLEKYKNDLKDFKDETD